MCETCDMYAGDGARLEADIDRSLRDHLRVMVALRDLGGVLTLLAEVACDFAIHPDHTASRAKSWAKDAQRLTLLANTVEN